jgi:hypothetical protein
MYSRIYKQIMIERNRRVREARDQVTREEESTQRARLISAGGKHAYQWLQIPPKAVRWGLSNINLPGHLFEIALRLRIGLTMKRDAGREVQIQSTGRGHGKGSMGPARQTPCQRLRTGQLEKEET